MKYLVAEEEEKRYSNEEEYLAAPEGQPQIIATQVLNNYLTPMSSSDQSSMDQLAFTNLSDPASVFKYKMGFFKVG